MKYSEENFPPLSKEEYEYLKDTLNENLDLYSGDDALYLRQYIVWEMLRHRLGKDPHLYQYWIDTYFPDE
jgi:hypothetical protein